MRRQATKAKQQGVHPGIRVHVEHGEARELFFSEPFRIGREPSCEVYLDSGLVSRVHAEVFFESGTWWVRDLQSTNGIFVDGEKVERAPLGGQTMLQLGRNAPTLQLSVEGALAERPTPVRSAPVTTDTLQPTVRRTVAPLPDPFLPPEPPRAAPEPPRALPPPERLTLPEAPRKAPSPSARAATGGLQAAAEPPRAAPPPAPGAPAGPDPSLSQVIRHYFDERANEPAGAHTQFIRQAYQTVKQKQQRRYTWIIAGVLMLSVLAAGYGVFERLRSQRLEEQAATLFMQMKELDVMTAQLQRVLEEVKGTDLERQLADIEARRQQMAARYEGFVEELGLYRRLDDEEKLIYRMARIFNESEFRMPGPFVGEVKRMIREHWMQQGRGTLITGIRRAQENGYIPFIVKTMQEHGLPPEFFYLALQESVFNTEAVGPKTNWGIAKGMWQFIPSTARRYNLQVGPREDLRVVDEQDDRMNFEKSTVAAARYLREIYSTPAQASGLLVMASYNWGEHRVIKKLEDLPDAHQVFDAVFEGIPENPEERNYWQFLEEYEDRMPEETKDYVLKIFSAAVIGQDPRRFGFDFDDPLKPYMETTGASAP